MPRQIIRGHFKRRQDQGLKITETYNQPLCLSRWNKHLKNQARQRAAAIATDRIAAGLDAGSRGSSRSSSRRSSIASVFEMGLMASSLRSSMAGGSSRRDSMCSTGGRISQRASCVGSQRGSCVENSRPFSSCSHGRRSGSIMSEHRGSIAEDVVFCGASQPEPTASTRRGSQRRGSCCEFKPHASMTMAEMAALATAEHAKAVAESEARGEVPGDDDESDSPAETPPWRRDTVSSMVRRASCVGHTVASRRTSCIGAFSSMLGDPGVADVGALAPRRSTFGHLFKRSLRWCS